MNYKDHTMESGKYLSMMENLRVIVTTISTKTELVNISILNYGVIFPILYVLYLSLVAWGIWLVKL